MSGQGMHQPRPDCRHEEPVHMHVEFEGEWYGLILEHHAEIGQKNYSWAVERCRDGELIHDGYSDLGIEAYGELLDAVVYLDIERIERGLYEAKA